MVDGVYSEKSGGFRTSEAECYPHLLDEALERTRLYADAVFGPGPASGWPSTPVIFAIAY